MSNVADFSPGGLHHLKPITNSRYDKVGEKEVPYYYKEREDTSICYNGGVLADHDRAFPVQYLCGYYFPSQPQALCIVTWSLEQMTAR